MAGAERIAHQLKDDELNSRLFPALQADLEEVFSDVSFE
jgi:hypothetical protein